MDEHKEEIIEDICSYAEKYAIKEMMQTYLKRVIIHRPQDPYQFLIDTITTDPYIAPAEVTSRPAAKSAKE